ncbi:hypothetical protein H7J07_12525 [Mycobacterium koreense]|uniref:Uncharacterized protein n=1 Tax=Mycolicibacillus koreensis TaxID=1069220 RepID=A0A7I7SCA6_9MYCO|nr:DUF6264 family protein [Mycolicibacillus koreensis]MCV7249040.1 hypothetical protein [Mycolicibacillus koreensis]OSC34094.1 hypothetical protein B8W67_08020 [Mycolicibacillus koreensis]BBY54554.1 hypothetical protein MKOR_18050 [Mycolicibacillus koreensis]
MSTHPVPPTPRRGGTADLVATVLLLVAQLLLYAMTMMVLGLMVMSTDNCAYVECGDEAWLARALALGFWSGGALLATTVTVSVIRRRRKRLTFFVPILGLIAQLGLGAVGLALESLAGPL